MHFPDKATSCRSPHRLCSFSSISLIFLVIEIFCDDGGPFVKEESLIRVFCEAKLVDNSYMVVVNNNTKMVDKDQG